MVKKPPLVELLWTDARDSSQTCRLSEDELRARVHLKPRTTRGLLVYQDDNKTILAHDYDLAEEGDDDRRPEVGNFTVIPTGWITHTRYIERGPKKKREVIGEKTPHGPEAIPASS